MDRDQIIKATNLVCDYLDELVQDKTRFENVGVPLSMKSVTGYKVTSITNIEAQIAVGVEFECSGLWNYSHSRFYFVRKNGEKLDFVQ